MSDHDMISKEHSVQEVEKSYSDMRLSECTEAPASIKERMSGSSSGDHHSVCRQSSDPSAMEDCDQSNKTEDSCLSGASSEPAVPTQGGAGGPGAANLLMKMMSMTGGETPMPGTPANMMSMLKEGGMPLPDMSAMSNGGMSAMGNKGMMKGGPLEMARIFDCIIDMSLARADSDDSEDEGDSATVELPCQYCHRCFPSQMTLKTHILVAHEQDDSVLNLTQLTISHNNGSQHSCDRSCSTEVFASGVSMKTLKQNAGSEGSPTDADLAAAETVGVRGVKRGRIESRDLETGETGGASGAEHQTGEGHDQTHPPTKLEPGVLPGSLDPVGSFDGNQRTSLMHSLLHAPKGSGVAQTRPKRSKRNRLHQKNLANNDDESQMDDSETSVSSQSVDDKHMHSLVSAHKCQTSAKRSPLEDARGTPSPQAAAAAGPSEQAGQSPQSARRSQRLCKAHC